MRNFIKYSLQWACMAHCFFEYVADVVVVINYYYSIEEYLLKSQLFRLLRV